MTSNLDYTLIMVATGFLGTGFGLTITTLNPFAYDLFPGKEKSAVTALHIMLGLGTTCTTVFLDNLSCLAYLKLRSIFGLKMINTRFFF